jgi:hypothetical protein
LLPLAFLLALAVACNGDSGPADLTAGEITDEQLSLMALPQSELGPEYTEFELDEDESGLNSNEQAIEDAFDPEDETADVERFGRLNGYGQQYSSFQAMLDGEGVFLVGTDVDLFEDSDGASGNFRDTVEDAKGQVGETREDLTIESAEEFDAGQIADESAGYSFRARPTLGEDGGSFHATTVGFRRGRIIGSAIIVRLDDEDVREEVTALVGKLDERIQAVLRGDIEADPAAQAEPTTEPEPTVEAEPTIESTSAPDAGVSPSDALDSFRFSAELAAEVGGSGFTLNIEGEFEGPDRLRCTISGSLGGTAIGKDELVVIGDDAWFDGGDGFEATTADDPDVVDDLDLCPGSPVFWEDFDFIEDPSPLPGEPDTKNGVEATRYALGEAAEALESIGFLPPDLEGLTINTFDVWLAEDGGWPVALDMDMSADAEAAGDIFGLPSEDGAQEAHITMRVDITDANDDDIRVEEPEE